LPENNCIFAAKDQSSDMAAKRPKASRLQSELAQKILKSLRDENAQPGHHLVELDLCKVFGVSRTPIRGALKLLAAEGVLNPRAGRGFVLAKLPPASKEEPASEDDEDRRLFDALARARGTGKLADAFTQQEIVRRFHAQLGIVMEVLRRLKELGLIERKSGHGWAFAGDSARLLNESYAFRRALEPQILLQPGFKLDRAWAELIRLVRKRGGCALMIDYGHTAERRPVSGSLAAYRDGRALEPAVGTGANLTAHVAVDAVRTAGEALGATTTFCGLQSEVVPELLQVETHPDPLVDLDQRSQYSALSSEYVWGSHWWLLQC